MLMREMGNEADMIDATATDNENRARRAVQEYALNKDGITYLQQGYSLPGGEIPLVKTVEHLVIADAIAQERRRMEKQHGNH